MDYNNYMLNKYYAEQELSDKMEHLDIHDSADYADYLADVANGKRADITEKEWNNNKLNEEPAR